MKKMVYDIVSGSLNNGIGQKACAEQQVSL